MPYLLVQPPLNHTPGATQPRKVGHWKKETHLDTLFATKQYVGICEVCLNYLRLTTQSVTVWFASSLSITMFVEHAWNRKKNHSPMDLY